MLKRHQHTAKYCLEKQRTDTLLFKCEDCYKEYSRPDSLKRHQRSCKRHLLEKDADSPQSQMPPHTDVGALAEMVAKLIQVPTQTPTPNCTRAPQQNAVNLNALTDAHILRCLDDLSLHYIMEGGIGYANYAGGYPFKDFVICPDVSRKKLRYKDENGRIVNDTGGFKLTQRFFQLIAPRNEQIIKTKYKLLQEQVDEIAESETTGSSNIVDLLEESTRLQQLLAESKAAANGKINNLTRDFVNHLTKIL